MAKKELNLDDLFAPAKTEVAEGKEETAVRTEPAKTAKKSTVVNQVNSSKKEGKKFLLRIDGDYYETLMAIAKSEKDSLNKIINKAIDEYISRHNC